MIKRKTFIICFGLICLLSVARIAFSLEQNQSRLEKAKPQLEKELLRWVPKELIAQHLGRMDKLISTYKQRRLPLSDTSGNRLRATSFVDTTIGKTGQRICVALYGDEFPGNKPKLRVLEMKKDTDEILGVLWDNPDSETIQSNLCNLQVEDINKDGFLEILVHFAMFPHNDCLLVWKWNGKKGELLEPDGKYIYFSSDQPAGIDAIDTDSDGVKEIVCFVRGYKPPAVWESAYRDIYKWDGKNYMLTKIDTLMR